MVERTQSIDSDPVIGVPVYADHMPQPQDLNEEPVGKQSESKTPGAPCIENFNIEGHWDWKHDGANVSGHIVLKPGGVLEHENDDSGGYWKFQQNGQVFLEFISVQHKLILSEDKKNLLLIEPFRYPPSVATFNRSLGEK